MGIVETVKDVASLVQKADNIELYQKILELQVQIMGLLEENHALTTKVRELQRTADLGDALEFRDNVYWLRTDKGEQGPYCSKCWDADGKTVRLQRLPDGTQWCPTCQRSAPNSKDKSGSEPLRRPGGRNPITGY